MKMIRPRHVPLVDIDATVEFDELWSVDVGNGQGQGLYRLQPAMNGDALYAASADGEVVAVDRSNGKTRWEVDLETSLSGGVGIFENTVLLGSSEGFVIKLDASSGAQLWSTPLGGEILSAPQSDGELVIAQTYNGKLQGLDFDTGKLLWTYDSNVPVLTVRGTSTPIMRNGRVFVGFANGRVLAFDVATGAIVWEVPWRFPRAVLKSNVLSMLMAPWSWWAMSSTRPATRGAWWLSMWKAAIRCGSRTCRHFPEFLRASAMSMSPTKTAQSTPIFAMDRVCAGLRVPLGTGDCRDQRR